MLDDSKFNKILLKIFSQKVTTNEAADSPPFTGT
jgi:hypothetical protein